MPGLNERINIGGLELLPRRDDPRGLGLKPGRDGPKRTRPYGGELVGLVIRRRHVLHSFQQHGADC